MTTHRLSASVLLFAVLVTHSAFADDFTSENFLLRDPSFNSFGGVGTSSSFESVLGETQIEGQRAESTNFILDMGPMNFDTHVFVSKNWRWYADEGQVTPQVPLGVENAAPTDIEDQDIIKLRVSVAETAGYGAEGAKLRLQFSTSSDFSTGVYDVAEQWGCTGSMWCYADGAGIDNALIASSTLSDADSCVSGVGSGCGTHNESGTTTSAQVHEPAAIAEYEFTIQQSGAPTNTAFFFRLFDVIASSTVPLDSGETYPSAVSGGSSLSFVIDGVPSGTLTEGVTTDITSTPTSIAFGILPSNTPVEAAQRLTVTTNGTAGYRIYMYERQAFLSETSAEIEAVTGTNATPTSWDDGCDEVAFSCFGYHSGDVQLSDGNVTRFAASDTYAQATSTPDEIAYHGSSVSEQSTDVVYKIEAREGQDNGNYSTSVVYVVVPVF